MRLTNWQKRFKIVNKKPFFLSQHRRNQLINYPKISVITVVRNGEATILDALNSVTEQTYPNIEHLVLDGMSSDGTFDLVQQQNSGRVKAFREPDEGLYDALNKGILKSSGDIIGFLHADDLLANRDVIAAIAEVFSTIETDSTYGDLVYTHQKDTGKIVRYWIAGDFKRIGFRRGWMPPHPTFYLKRECYERFGLYETGRGTAADYELMLRMLYKNKLNAKYIPKTLVKMRTGGASNVSLRNRLKANEADRNAWIENGIRPPFGIRFTKPLSKCKQFFLRPNEPPIT